MFNVRKYIEEKKAKAQYRKQEALEVRNARLEEKARVSAKITKELEKQEKLEADIKKQKLTEKRIRYAKIDKNTAPIKKFKGSRRSRVGRGVGVASGSRNVFSSGGSNIQLGGRNPFYDEPKPKEEKKKRIIINL